MHRRRKSLCIAWLGKVRHPERLSQIDRPFKAPTEQYKVDKSARLDRRRVEESSFRRSQPHAEKERQCPEVKHDMILPGRRSVFEPVRFPQAKQASAEWLFSDLTAHEAERLLERDVYPVVFHLIA